MAKRAVEKEIFEIFRMKVGYFRWPTGETDSSVSYVSQKTNALIFFYTLANDSRQNQAQMLVLLSIYPQSATGPIVNEEKYRRFVNKERDWGRGGSELKTELNRNPLITHNDKYRRSTAGTWAEKRVFHTVLRWENRRFG